MSCQYIDMACIQLMAMGKPLQNGLQRKPRGWRGSSLEKTEKEVLFIFLLFNVKPETIEKLLEMCRMRQFPRSLKLESALDLQSFGTGPS